MGGKFKICPVCKKEFLDKNYKSKTRPATYCSLKCFGQTIAKYKKCENCKRYFYNYANARFCSMKCSGEFKRNKPLSDLHRRALSLAKLGKPIAHFIKNKELISKKISEALKGRSTGKFGELHPNWRGGITKKIRHCPVCKKEFETYNSVHCSMLCANKNKNSYIRRRRNPNLDLHFNPPKNYKRLHAKMNNLYGKPNFCEICGTTEDRRYVWANADHLYLNTDRKFWLRLCCPCHHKYDKGVL